MVAFEWVLKLSGDSVVEEHRRGCGRRLACCSKVLRCQRNLQIADKCEARRKQAWLWKTQEMGGNRYSSRECVRAALLVKWKALRRQSQWRKRGKGW
jgi:hypothetical protein